MNLGFAKQKERQLREGRELVYLALSMALVMRLAWKSYFNLVKYIG